MGVILSSVSNSTKVNLQVKQGLKFYQHYDGIHMMERLGSAPAQHRLERRNWAVEPHQPPEQHGRVVSESES